MIETQRIRLGVPNSRNCELLSVGVQWLGGQMRLLLLTLVYVAYHLCCYCPVSGDCAEVCPHIKWENNLDTSAKYQSIKWK